MSNLSEEGKEYNLLLKRFRHLIKSKIISSYDEVNNNGEYIKNIDTFDIDFISKDKIKDKIKEIQGHIKKDFTGYYWGTDKSAIDVLYELLDE